MICGTKEMTMTATSFFLPEPTCGRACVPRPRAEMGIKSSQLGSWEGGFHYHVWH